MSERPAIRIAKITIDVLEVPGTGTTGRIKVETQSGDVYWLPDNPSVNPRKAKNRLFDAALDLARDTWSLV